MRRSTLVLVVVLAILAATTGPAAARPVVHAVPAFPITNGRNLAAWVGATGLRFAGDDGLRRTFPLPDPSCSIGGVNSTEAGLLCGIGPSTLRLVNAVSGQVREPASEPLIASFTKDGTPLSTGYALGALGDAIAQVDGFEDHVGSWSGWFRLDAEQRLPSLRPSPGFIVDLDTPAGIRRLCAPSATAPAWVLSIRAHRVRLRRCGVPGTRIVGRTPFEDSGLLTRRYAAWLDAGAHVVVRMLATGRTYHFHARSTRLVGTAHRLWITNYTGSAVRVIDL